jgi:hypothetical protein
MQRRREHGAAQPQPKSSDGNFFVETITPIEHNYSTGYGKGIPVESIKPDVGAFASRSGMCCATHATKFWQHREQTPA